MVLLRYNNSLLSGNKRCHYQKDPAARDEYIVAWLRLLSSVPYLLIALFIIEMPETDSTFWAALITALPLEVTAFILYIRALKESPLSLTIPFLAFTPVFLIVTSFLILGELPDKSGAAG